MRYTLYCSSNTRHCPPQSVNAHLTPEEKAAKLTAAVETAQRKKALTERGKPTALPLSALTVLYGCQSSTHADSLPPPPRAEDEKVKEKDRRESGKTMVKTKAEMDGESIFFLLIFF
jgi:hypothetical protein